MSQNEQQTRTEGNSSASTATGTETEDREAVSGTEEKETEGGNSRSKARHRSNKVSGNGDREDSRDDVSNNFKTDALGIRESRFSTLSGTDERLEFLRANCQIRDWQKLREEFLNATDFGGLKASVSLIFQCLDYRVFKKWDDAQIREFLFALGCRRETTSVMLDRLNLYTEMLALRIVERMKSEKDWREIEHE